jgi:anthranilate phosphoribosyltransferase
MSLAIPMDLSDFDPIDIVGTGGDEKNTSTFQPAVVCLAGAGLQSCQTGNYESTSISGSSNVLEYYGAKFTTDTDVVRRHWKNRVLPICMLHSASGNENVAPSVKISAFAPSSMCLAR